MTQLRSFFPFSILYSEQSVPHSGVRDALLAPTVTPALPDAVRSVFRAVKSSAPHGAELPSPASGSRLQQSKVRCAFPPG